MFSVQSLISLSIFSSAFRTCDLADNQFDAFTTLLSLIRLLCLFKTIKTFNCGVFQEYGKFSENNVIHSYTCHTDLTSSSFCLICFSSSLLKSIANFFSLFCHFCAASQSVTLKLVYIVLMHVSTYFCVTGYKPRINEGD